MRKSDFMEEGEDRWWVPTLAGAGIGSLYGGLRVGPHMARQAGTGTPAGRNAWMLGTGIGMAAGGAIGALTYLLTKKRGKNAR